MGYKLFTIGYEGRTIDEFILILKRNGITRLLDIREIAASRKKGFSKSQLNDRLKGENIEYFHIKELGSPKEIRNKLRRDWDYTYFFEMYEKYISNNIDSITNAYKFLADGVNCIMCFERLPNECHRFTVAKKIKQYDGNGLKIEHI